MATAPSLPVAATQSFDNLYALFLANTLKTKLALFSSNLLPQFEQQQEQAHPVSNWLVLIATVSDQMPSSAVPYAQFSAAVDYIYRCCWMTNQLGNVQTLITSAQAAAVLAQYNAQF